jgi:hypothetical protein
MKIDPGPFDDCEIVVGYGGTKPGYRHLDSIIYCVNEEIVGFLERRGRRRPSPPPSRTMPPRA